MWRPLKFANSVRKHWGGLVTSGAIIGALSIWQSTGHAIPANVYWIIAVVGVVIAAYRAWLDKHDQLETREQEIGELRTKLDAVKRWSFEAEFLRAVRSVYLYENGNSPHITIFVWALVHNRNPEPTTVYVRHVSVKLKNRTDEGFQPVAIVPGGQFNFDNPEEYRRYDVGGSSSIELLFDSRRYNPPDISEYVSESALAITLELCETFGNRVPLTGPLTLGEVTKQ